MKMKEIGIITILMMIIMTITITTIIRREIILVLAHTTIINQLTETSWQPILV